MMRNNFRTYLLSLLGGVAVITAAIIAFTVFVDPYALYREHDRLTGLENHTRLIKPAWAGASNANVFMVGSSRAEYLLDPEVVSRLTNKPAFNIAASGANTYEMRPQEIQFYDSNHLSWNMRERFLTALLGGAGSDERLGVVLTPSQIDAHLAAILVQRADWQNANPSDMAVFDELVSEAEATAAQN